MANFFHYPADLPVSEHRAEILDALRASRVIIVCGDTGSGKTTQLPKMALEDWETAKDARHGLGHRRIACTQPRRLAAVTMAERVAEELRTEVGALVGYRHRFGRKVTSETRIEFMTDGVLLAETRFDPLLRAYGTIIVDEAHERSLNVDFLLGILKRILAVRHDLKVIISSATLDAARFSEFFDGAPVISVPGRLFPIEIGYRPPPEDEERDLPRVVANAVAELPAKDDILVFLPGERDIRETADYLNETRGGFDDIIPLLASLPGSEQRRAFQSSPRRRIILATNVAETSVTIPGIRAVIDSGLARISRYIHRTQIQRLQIEPISQASARQRAGRCGRLGPGICLRLYSEEDFLSRDAYTPPEVLRSSLAGVILTMLDLQLGAPESFPFLDPPKPTMVREGLRELLELGAIKRKLFNGSDGSDRSTVRSNGTESQNKGIELTDIGRKLAKIPVEPRLARMLIAASDHAVLPAVLPLVAAMACDDPRRRPMEEKEKADQVHARFRVAGSDFLGTLKLWQWWIRETADLSQTKARKLCKQSYLSYPKMREWRDLTRQLEGLCRKMGLGGLESLEGSADFSARFHLSLLSGLLGRIGCWNDEERIYRGAFGLRFALHPSSVLSKPPKPAKPSKPAKPAKPSFPSWVVAGELVDTSRLFARNAAVIDVNWLERVAGPVCKHSYHSPEWDARSGFVRATEQVTLYGLVIVPARRCDYSRINPALARELFIRHGLIDGDFPKPPPEIRANQQLLEALRRRAERTRHPEIFDAAGFFAHFDRVVPSDICSADALRKWLRRPAHTSAEQADRAAFTLKKADWWPAEATGDDDFPDELRVGGARLALSYRHVPDDPENDGVTCSVRASDVSALRLWRADWLVPGLLSEKLAWMLGTLPSALRRVLSPLDETLAILQPMLKPGALPLEKAVREAVFERWGFHIPEGVWNWEKLPPHLRMRFRLRDDSTGRTLAVSRRLEDIFAVTARAPSASAEANRHSANAPATSWIFGDLPEKSVDRNAGWETISYPALRIDGEGVSLGLFAEPHKAGESHAAAVTRLLTLALGKSAVVPFRRNRLDFEAALYLKEIDYSDAQISADLFTGAVAETFVRNRPPIRSAADFESRLKERRTELVQVQTEMAALMADSAAAAERVTRLLGDERISDETADSVAAQLAWLVFRGFVRTVPLAILRRYPRYLKGAVIRLERARLGMKADREKEARFAPFWQNYLNAVRERAKYDSTQLDEFRWMLEEYRISLFAQELHTPEPVSPKRLDAKWAALQGNSTVQGP